MVRTRRLAGPLCSLLPLCIRAGGRIVRFSLRQLSLLFPPPFRPCPLPPAPTPHHRCPLGIATSLHGGMVYVYVYFSCCSLFRSHLSCHLALLPASRGVTALSAFRCGCGAPELCAGAPVISRWLATCTCSVYMSPGVTGQRCPLDCSAPWAFASAHGQHDPLVWLDY